MNKSRWPQMTLACRDLNWPLVFCLILILKLFADWVLLSDLDFSRYCHSILKCPPFWIYNLRGIWCCFAFEFPKKRFKSVVLSDWLIMSSNQDKFKKEAVHILPEAFWTYPTYLPMKLPICFFAPSAFELWMAFILGNSQWEWKWTFPDEDPIWRNYVPST